MTILVQLKERTKSTHDKLEKDLNLLRPDYTLSEYTDLLKRFYGIYKPLEIKLDLPENRQKLPHLEMDLRHFKVDLLSIPLADNLPDLTTRNHYYGVRYVLEGSTLGGQVLTKHYKEIFHMSPDSGCFFFSGYGKETMLMWKEFQNELLEFSKSEDYCEETVIRNAKVTFEILYDWLIPSN